MRKMRGKSTTPAKSSSRTRAVRTGITLTSQQSRMERLRWRIPGTDLGKNTNNSAIDVGDACGCRSEEHTSELQSQSNLVCRLLLEKKKKENRTKHIRREITDPARVHEAEDPV